MEERIDHLFVDVESTPSVPKAGRGTEEYEEAEVNSEGAAELKNDYRCREESGQHKGICRGNLGLMGGNLVEDDLDRFVWWI